ncbi:type IV secretory system conjugative DNA transfer family protein [Aquipuribacter nitratireducens]|uniref:Type IV secretory system conjugative DNA transfer family protein n=1 Tax=Aquipuribacter nitratireducens TaxID=650104 RepID=A0ABW0GQ55_9MICO
MSATTKRTSTAAAGETTLLWVGVLGAALVTGVVAGAAHLGHRLDDTGVQLPHNPFSVLFGVLSGTLPWTTSATSVAGGLTASLAAAAATVAVLWWRRGASRVAVDRAAPHLTRGSALRPMSRLGATATASRLGVEGSPGLPLGWSLTGQELFSSWEDNAVDIWGPRTGKTTARAIPAVLAAPGAVLATSNKRDLVDATRDPRAELGPVWVFDPQGVAEEEPSWWWNPLTYVTDEVKASILADLFATAARDPGARTDAYFDAAARELLAGLLLAAAVARRPLTQVYLWLTDPTDDEPVALLREAGYPLPASSVSGVVNAPDKQRAGVYGTAQQQASFMTNRQAMAWVTDSPAGGGVATPDLGGALNRRSRRQFSTEDFVRTTGTLYSLSREGRGSAGPLVAALTVAVTEAAEQLAIGSAGGRLPVPLVAVLDEAANVCRWRELPNLYSHYGSRGIVMMTILQSWSQGVEVWGRDGMRKLWSAANVKVYGGGVSEVEFLSELSQLIGDYDVRSVSTSTGRSGRSTSRSVRRERVLDVSDLGSLPRGRALLLASGVAPTLIKTAPWMTGPHAKAVLASIAAHDPSARVRMEATG